MDQKFDLRIGDGIGPFKFGMTQSEVMDTYGKPYRRDPSSGCECIYYHIDDLELHFYGKNEQRLTDIVFYLKEDVFYKDEQIMGKPKDHLINSLFADIQNWDIIDGDGNYEDYHCKEKRLGLTFVDDKLDSIHLGKIGDDPASLYNKFKGWLYGGK